MTGRGPWIAVSLIVLSGCGGLDLAQVTGRVTVGSKPISEGMILFVPEHGPAAVGVLQSDGTYSLKTHRAEGALVGKHRVAIQATRVGAGKLVEPKNITEELEQARKPGKMLVAGEITWLVPEKYSRPETSGLTAEIVRGINVIPFDLP